MLSHVPRLELGGLRPHPLSNCFLGSLKFTPSFHVLLGGPVCLLHEEELMKQSDDILEEAKKYEKDALWRCKTRAISCDKGDAANRTAR